MSKLGNLFEISEEIQDPRRTSGNLRGLPIILAKVAAMLTVLFFRKKSTPAL
jgi:hypothetical protein